MAPGASSPARISSCFVRIGVRTRGLIVGCEAQRGGSRGEGKNGRGWTGRSRVENRRRAVVICARDRGLLTRATRAAWYSAEDLSRATRIPIRSLDRLEAGFFDGDPDGFVRGFVRTVAEALGLDPSETIARMLVEPTPETPSQGVESPRMAWFHSPLVWGLCGLLVVLAWGLLRWVSASSPPPSQAPRDAVVLRIDPVRRLAEAHAGERLNAGGLPHTQPTHGESALSGADVPKPSQGP